MSCTNCGSAFHEKWACPKPLKPSTAARKDVQRGTQKRSTLVRQVAGFGESQSAKVAGARLSGDEPDPHQQVPGTAPLAVGTQAQPVDTKPRSANRHKPGYFTDYMRKRRAKAKETK